jgi:hypothetical protein
MKHPSQKLNIRAIALTPLLMAVIAGSALPAHQAQAYEADSEGGWTVQNSFTSEPFAPSTDHDAGVNHSPQELPPSTPVGEAPDEADWTVVGLPVVIAVAGALILARRAR